MCIYIYIYIHTYHIYTYICIYIYIYICISSPSLPSTSLPVYGLTILYALLCVGLGCQRFSGKVSLSLSLSFSSDCVACPCVFADVVDDVISGGRDIGPRRAADTSRVHRSRPRHHGRARRLRRGRIRQALAGQGSLIIMIIIIIIATIIVTTIIIIRRRRMIINDNNNNARLVR